MLRDLDIQWRDHLHMRDQTWKTVTASVLLFLGIVGLEFKEVGDLVMVPAYLLVALMAFVGWAVASHHRLRQKQKFAIITIYEKELGIFELKRKILEEAKETDGLASKVFTAGFIRAVHICIGIVALLLLARRLFRSA